MLQWQPVQRTHECKYIPCNDIAGEQSNCYETSFYTFREQLPSRIIISSKNKCALYLRLYLFYSFYISFYINFDIQNYSIVVFFMLNKTENFLKIICTQYFILYSRNS